ncbi:MAG: hypothetical protein LBV27_04595, partial [Oscillospiraceae bacterium]|nr:hypothetical protein [Oscillospiraceae bacterium]
MSHIHKKSRITVITAVFLIMAVVLTLFSNLTPALHAQAAEVTIKTQKAADGIKNGIRGIDVSKYQGTINWKKVATDDVKFAMCRATYGTDIDPTFVTNAKGANDNGLYVGAYHYARIKDSASVKKEAAAFIKQLKKVTLTYPVVLDIENHYGLSKTKLSNLAI